MIKNVIKSFFTLALRKNRIRGISRAYIKEVNIFAENFADIKVDLTNEKQHIKKWSVLLPKVSSIWFKVYSQYIGYEDINIVPDNIFHIFIEQALNSYHLNYLSDEKNYYDKLYADFNPPLALVRNINGVYADKNYSNIVNFNQSIELLMTNHSKIIIKPAVVSGSGRNVDVFELRNNQYLNKNSIVLTKEYLEQVYKKDFIVQEFLLQSVLLSKYNKESINTLRIFTYRSVITNEVHVLHTVLRVGKKGQFVDNAHAGGMFCAVQENGCLSKKIFNDKGHILTDFNGITISDNDCMPNFDIIVNFAKSVGENTYHSRILSLDIMIDENDLPRLVEINSVGQGVMFFQMSTGALFGKYTDEVIDYCCKNSNLLYNVESLF